MHQHTVLRCKPSFRHQQKTTASTASHVGDLKIITKRLSTVCSAAVVERASFKADKVDTFAPLINGCWQFAGGHGREPLDNVQAKLAAHADAGFDTFDTADIYGPSEGILGEFQQTRRASGKPPVKIFTKYVPNIFQQRPTPALVEASVRRSMRNLQMDTLDCVQMHWWDYNVPGMVDTAKALADLQAKGMIKHVGLTNCDCNAVQSVLDAGVQVACNQVQFSLLDRRPLNGMLQLCEQHGVKIFAYGPVGGGLLSDKYYAEPKQGMFGQARYPPLDLNTSSLKMYWNITKRFGGEGLWRELLLTLNKVATKHNVSMANVAVRWIMQQGNGSTVHPIIGMRGVQHIADNARALSLVLDASDLAAIQEVLSKAQGPKGDIYSFERGE